MVPPMVRRSSIIRVCFILLPPDEIPHADGTADTRKLHLDSGGASRADFDCAQAEQPFENPLLDVQISHISDSDLVDLTRDDSCLGHHTLVGKGENLSIAVEHCVQNEKQAKSEKWEQTNAEDKMQQVVQVRGFSFPEVVFHLETGFLRFRLRCHLVPPVKKLATVLALDRCRENLLTAERTVPILGLRWGVACWIGSGLAGGRAGASALGAGSWIEPLQEGHLIVCPSMSSGGFQRLLTVRAVELVVRHFVSPFVECHKSLSF